MKRRSVVGLESDVEPGWFGHMERSDGAGLADGSLVDHHFAGSVQAPVVTGDGERARLGDGDDRAAGYAPFSCASRMVWDANRWHLICAPSTGTSRAMPQVPYG